MRPNPNRLFNPAAAINPVRSSIIDSCQFDLRIDFSLASRTWHHDGRFATASLASTVCGTFLICRTRAEEALYDSESMRRFVGLELGEDAIPDESTILRFRHLLERHSLAGKLFAIVGKHLQAKRPVVKSGTIVDATIIAAPPSTKNRDKARDPEMRQTRKGRKWHFGMKLHIGSDARGTVHSVTATHAGAADIKQLPELLRGEEKVLFGEIWNTFPRLVRRRRFHRSCNK